MRIVRDALEEVWTKEPSIPKRIVNVLILLFVLFVVFQIAAYFFDHWFIHPIPDGHDIPDDYPVGPPSLR